MAALCGSSPSLDSGRFLLLRFVRCVPLAVDHHAKSPTGEQHILVGEVDGIAPKRSGISNGYAWGPEPSELV